MKEKNEIIINKTRNNENPKINIKNLYGEEYDKLLSSMKEIEEKTKKYFNDVEKVLLGKFEIFNSNLEKYFVNLGNQFAQAFDIKEENIDKETIKLIKSRTKKSFEMMNRIKNMQEQILESIKLSISVLFNLLNIPKYFEKEKPVQEFLEQEFNNIINSWLFFKLEFENFNLTKSINNSDLNKDLKEFMYKVCQNKKYVMNVGSSKRNVQGNPTFEYEQIKEQDSAMISENSENLTKMRMNNILNADEIFESIKDFPKLRYLKFNNCLFSENMDKIGLIGKCTKLEKLIFNGVNRFEAKILQNFSNNLTKLVLSNNNFVNSDFENIMKNYLISSEQLKKNLEYLSFSNNCLSRISLDKLFPARKKFTSLKELDFHKNKIFQFTISSDNFIDLQCINCCNNKFTYSPFGENKDVIALMSGNLFLRGEKNSLKYFNLLAEQLTDKKISLSNLTISFLPFDYRDKYLEKLVINNNILFNLKKLNLSSNNLNCDTLFTFIESNKRFISLKDLNLSRNLLDDTFFEKYLEYNYHSIFTNIKKINLSDNLIGNSCEIKTKDLGEAPNFCNLDIIPNIFKLRLIYKFIERNKSLSKLYLTKNPMGEKLIIADIEDKSNFQNEIKKDENKNIIIDSFYSFLKKIKDEILINKGEKNNRGQLNIRFDIDKDINLDSDCFDLNKKYITFKQ